MAASYYRKVPRLIDYLDCANRGLPYTIEPYLFDNSSTEGRLYGKIYLPEKKVPHKFTCEAQVGDEATASQVYIRKVQEMIQERLNPRKKHVTILELLELVLKKTRGTPEYLSQIRQGFKRLASFMQDCSIQAVTHERVQHFFEFVNKGGEFTSSTNTNHSVLSMGFNLAVNYDYIEKNPFKGVKPKVKRGQQPLLTLAEFAQGIARLSADNYRLRACIRMLMILMYTGRRPCELRRLKVNDVSRESKTVTLRATKNGRDYPMLLPPNVFSLFDEQLQDKASQGGRVACSDWVFPCRSGEVAKRTLSMWMRPLFRVAWPNKRVTLYTFRHSYATKLRESGVAIDDIRVMLTQESVVATSSYVNPKERIVQERVNRVVEAWEVNSPGLGEADSSK